MTSHPVQENHLMPHTLLVQASCLHYKLYIIYNTRYKILVEHNLVAVDEALSEQQLCKYNT